MENFRGANLKSFPYTGKQSLLPPKSPFRIMSSPYAEHGSSSIGSKGVPKQKEGQRHHQRTSSESYLVEEQLSWLDDLLNEPETPVRRGTHRRSSSDSFAYLEASSSSFNVDNITQGERKHRNLMSAPSWGPFEFDRVKDVHHSSFYTDNSFGRQQSTGWECSPNSVTYSSVHPSQQDKSLIQRFGSSSAPLEPDSVPSTATKKEDRDESSAHDREGSSERSDCSNSKPSSETDQKRARQQFAQRSRVRKLQYIAELERNVQSLQAEGSEVLAEFGFLEQQNLILNMENKALKQRLDSLAQEQLVKYLEQEMLEREIARLRAIIYQQHHQDQQEQPSPSIHHRRRSSRDLDSQFASLSLKHKEANSAREPHSGPLWT